jgi:hypothetical protein
MAYDIRGIVAKKTHLSQIAASDARLGIVDLDEPSFALLPLTKVAASACLDKWGANLTERDVQDLLDPAIAIRLLERMSNAALGAPIAFVEAHSFGDPGVSLGLVVGLGPTKIFDRTPDPWPDTNISMALKAIGVPERLDLRQDAFDVAGLGRKRHTERWLLTDQPWERRPET